ncbi:DUF4034 domain-containing protein [bacterium]|nr:MAG: DUF4034 domain-containing protein [bacterium]
MYTPGPPLQPKRSAFRWQFLLGFFIALSALCIIYWNRFQMWEQIRNYQIPEPERSQRAAFASQMDALQNQGQYSAMRIAAAKWRKTHPADPNGFASEGFAAYYLGDLGKSVAAWEKAAAMDPLIGESAGAWVGAVNEVRGNWPGPIPPAVLAQNDLLSAEKLWHQKGAALLAAGKFDEIENTIAQLLKSRTELADGRWLATFFFEGASEPAEDEKNELRWASKMKQVEVWNAAKPNSDLAELALAASWIRGAYIARGEGYASTVTEEGDALKFERLKNAKVLLSQQMASGGKTPLFIWVFHNFSQLSGIKGAPYDAIVDREIAAFPTFSQAVFCKAIHLLPRWYGERDDWEFYAGQAADNVGGVAGDILYARTFWRMHRRYRLDDVWEGRKTDWPRAKRGFEAILKRYPNSLTAANTYFVFAIANQDNALGRKLLKDYIGGKVEPEYWTDTKYFVRTRMSTLQTK